MALGALYVRKVSEFLTNMPGTDYNRDAPRRDDLDHYLSTDPSVYGPFQKVTANNVTIGDISSHLAIDGSPRSWLHYDPRIGMGATPGTPVSRAHGWQLVTAKTLWGTDFASRWGA